MVSQARIGHTLKQCIAEYGLESEKEEESPANLFGPNFTVHYFSVRDVRIICLFKKGKDAVVEMTYRRAETPWSRSE